MNNSEVYEELMIHKCLGKMKGFRDQWSRGQWFDSDMTHPADVPCGICEIGEQDHSFYSFIMKMGNEMIYNSIIEVVDKLFEIYQISAVRIPVQRKDAYLYCAQDFQQPFVSPQHNQRQVLAVVLRDDGRNVLYIFKEFGIGERLPNPMIELLKNQYDCNSIKYVSLVEEKAYSEILNHSYDEDDETRGTGIYSIRQFFEKYFSADEFQVFCSYRHKLLDATRDYLGFSIVKTLRPNALHHFKRDVKRELQSFGRKTLSNIEELSSTQADVLETQLFENGTCEALTGNRDFARSFLTAEWLYSSLQGADNIDLAVIPMGYFKSIEQFLLAFITLRTKEKGYPNRKIYMGKSREGKLYAKGAGKSTNHYIIVDKDGYADLTDHALGEGFEHYLMLGSLTGFFGHRNKGGLIDCRNRDFLLKNINDDTYGCIVDTLDSIIGLRNGYFHKENLYDWSDVDEIRRKVYLAFCLVLGAYSLSDEDKTALDVSWVNRHDDYYHLCNYMNSSTGPKENNPLEIPVFYLDDVGREGDAFFACADSDINGYDKYGDPIYSGIYFKTIGSKAMFEYHFGVDNLPQRISQGKLVISSSAPVKCTLSGPEKIVFENGVFLDSSEKVPA